MTKPRLPLWLFASVGLSALLAVYSVYKRFQVETENRATSLALEYENVESIASSQGITIDKAIVDLKAQGLNALVLSESTISELVARGQASLESTTFPVLTNSARHIEPMATLTFFDLTQVPRAERGLRIRFQSLANRLQGRTSNVLDLPNVSPMLIRTTPIGLDPEQVDCAKRNGLMIIARCANPQGVSSTGVKQTLEWVHEMGATIFLPEGDQVLGRRDSIETTVDTLRQLSMLYATPEFAKIGGDTNIVETAPEIIVRLHSAQVAELDKLTPDDAIDRYAKASRERNMRILLIRPLTYAAPQPNAALAMFIKGIDEQITREGGAIGLPKPYREPTLPRPIQVLLGLAIAPCVWFAVAAFVKNRNVRLAGAVLIGLLGLACLLHIGQHAMAFFASVSFPFLGFLVADELPDLHVPRWAQPLPAFVVISLFSLLGGLCVAGLLNDLHFYVKADEFRGIKVASFLPILVVGAYYLARLTDIRKSLTTPINWSTMLLGLVILGMLGLMIARSGNDTGASAGEGELAFRGILDRVMFVRPRTKEFLVGHPILIVGLGLLAFVRRPRRQDPELAAVESPPDTDRLAGWAALALMVGSMGQTDIVNTLCHLHVPVMLSVARIGLGALLGCIIGVVLWAIVSGLLPKAEA